MTGPARSGAGGIAVIGVNYGTDDMALRFVQSAAALQPSTTATVLVDNSEGPQEREIGHRLRAEGTGVLYVRAPRNLGYFCGADYGLRQYVAVHGEPDWVVVSNVDIRFDDPCCLNRLQDFHAADDVGVVAPSIWSRRSRRDLNPRMRQRPGAAAMHMYKIVFGTWATLNAYELLAAAKHTTKYLLKHYILEPLRQAPSDGAARRIPPLESIYAPQGSCVIFSNRFFERGGSLVYPSFLFGEEIYVAETARHLGLRVIYHPGIRVSHDDHSSTGLVRSRRVARLVKASARYIADRYFR